MKSRNLLAVAATLALVGLSSPALAQSPGDWTLGVGVHAVEPKSDNGTLAGTLRADVDEDIRPTITAEYFIGDNLGIEVLAAAPFKHDIRLDGAKAGETKHLPPVVSLQYHFNSQGRVSPFLGLGVNYTRFFEERSNPEGPLAGAGLKLDGSWGLAAHAGLDFRISDRSALRVDARWIDIETDVSVEGLGKVGSADLDPIVYGVAWIWKF
ncbi:outer membrane beta-barrel protein [Lysobacter sp. GX 14042]|uniref:OmpW/AlkL family protein n=1 Tax=Lysobacter sp. GX 14042 TaxID=2907155 RepID=UPI001F401C77|nr:OmpW family outer membrane protein [Lysobacter sp. GX 14042]MCE7033548.1 outer membrane beta-barrel protein [Lysobacter sp. GX 14042]